MDRIDLARYSLIASAFVLAGLLIVNLPDRVVPTAHAELVINKENLTLMTAKTRPGEEALFVLDGSRGKLLIYRLDVGRKQLELSGSADLAQLFQNNQQDDQDNRNRRSR